MAYYFLSTLRTFLSLIDILSKKFPQLTEPLMYIFLYFSYFILRLKFSRFSPLKNDLPSFIYIQDTYQVWPIRHPMIFPWLWLVDYLNCGIDALIFYRGLVGNCSPCDCQSNARRGLLFHTFLSNSSHYFILITLCMPEGIALVLRS